jgi:hypothetical protein
VSLYRGGLIVQSKTEDLKTEIRDLKRELKTDIWDVRKDVKADIWERYKDLNESIRDGNTVIRNYLIDIKYKN